MDLTGAQYYSGTLGEYRALLGEYWAPLGPYWALLGEGFRVLGLVWGLGLVLLAIPPAISVIPHFTASHGGYATNPYTAVQDGSITSEIKLHVL